MKSFIKKLIVAVCASAASITLITASVSATDQPRPLPGTEATTGVTSETSSGSSSVSVTSDDAQSVTQTSVSTDTNKKYLTKLGGFELFILSVLVNFILSCWIGNRFYQLSRRNSQTSNEIRALRKDIEEKFASTLTDVEDPSIEIMNRNENYSRTDEGISMPEHKSHIEMNDEEREMMRKWDKRRIMERVIAKEEAETPEEEEHEEVEAYEPKPARREYQPTRRASGIEFEDDDENDDEEYEEVRPARMQERRPSKKSSNAKAIGKAKDFLNNIFPFED